MYLGGGLESSVDLHHELILVLAVLVVLGERFEADVIEPVLLVQASAPFVVVASEAVFRELLVDGLHVDEHAFELLVDEQFGVVGARRDHAQVIEQRVCQALSHQGHVHCGACDDKTRGRRG